MSSEEKAIVVKEPEVLVPASVEKTLLALKRFQEFKERALDENDYQVIKDKKYIKKSGWLKYALACNISLELLKEEREQRDGQTIYHYTYRAIAPSGRFADAVGSASTKERAFVREVHDVRALAQTRAMERAISNLVGGGELGAEELLGEEEASAAKPEAVQGPAPQQAGRTQPQADEIAANFDDLGDGKALRCKTCSMLVSREDALKHLQMHRTKKLASEGQKNYIRYLSNKLGRELPEDLDKMTFEEASLYIDYLKGEGARG
jgi:hypothetical protein